MIKEDMQFNYSKLRGRIVEVYGTICNFSKKMEMSPNRMGRLLKNDSEWNSTEIVKACKLLDIKMVDIKDYFFTIVEK